MWVKLALGLTLCLMMSLEVSCVADDQAPVVTKGIDLCVSGIAPFGLTDGEVLKHDNLKNAVLINKLLQSKCGQEVPNTKAIKKIA